MKRFKVIFVVGVVMCSSTWSYAQEAASPPSEFAPSHSVDMNQRITLDLRNMDINDVLKYLSLRSGANIVASKIVTGEVTLQLKDVPLLEAYDIILLTNDLAYEKRGEIYYVMTAQEYEDRYGQAFSDIRKVKMYQLKYAVPQKAFELLDMLKSTIGRVQVDEESGTVLMVDTQEKIREMENALSVMEKKGDVHVFNLQYAVAKDVEEQLRSQLDDKNVASIWSDERNNQVIVSALPDRMGGIRKIIAALDKKTKEILIDTKVVKVDFPDQFSASLEWEDLFQQLNGWGFLGRRPLESMNRSDETSESKASSTQEIYFGRQDGSESFKGLLQFLSTFGEAQLLSNPKLAVINNQKARIHVGRKEAYIATTTTSGATITTTAEDVNFIDVGIQLVVTPTINDDGFITMKIRPEVSHVVDVLTTPLGNKIPIVDTFLAETTVMVRHGSTVIISGFPHEEEEKGAGRSEFLVMITPHIVDAFTMAGDVALAEEETK